MLNRELVLAYLTALNVGMSFLNIPPGISVLLSLYHVSYTGISVLMSALLWSHAFMQVPSGMVADRLGMRRTLWIGMSFLLCGNILPAARPFLSVAVVGRVLAGIGTALTFVTCMKMIAVHAPKGRIGAFQAFFAALFSFGNILSYYSIPKLIAYDWRWVYLVPGLYSLVLLCLLSTIRPAPAPLSPVRSLRFRGVLRLKVVWVVAMYHALSWGATINLGNWIPSLLADYWPGSSAVQLAWGAIVVLLVSGIARFSGGFFLLRIAPRFVVHASILIMAVSFIGLTLAGGPELLLPLSIVAAFFSSLNFGALFHLASSAGEPGSMATIIGFVNFLANLGAVLFTILFGFSKDLTGSFAMGFGVLAVLSLVAFPLGRRVLAREGSGETSRG